MAPLFPISLAWDLNPRPLVLELSALLENQPTRQKLAPGNYLYSQAL